jgi:hypothetical protein
LKGENFKGFRVCEKDMKIMVKEVGYFERATKINHLIGMN